MRAYRDGPIGFIVLNQPEMRNALSLEMRRLLRQRVEEMRGDRSVRAIVLAGEGKAFCAGGDLKTLHGQAAADVLNRQHDVQALIRAMMTGDAPIIAAVEGWALGAGLSIALACDIVVAGKDARFGAVFGKVGLAPDLGITWTLPRRVGIGRTRLALLTGRIVSGETAVDWGMVDELVETGAALDAAAMIAGEIAANAPTPSRLIRRILAEQFNSLDQALDFEAVTQTLLVGSADFDEGFAAFQGKRPPVFQGR